MSESEPIKENVNLTEREKKFKEEQRKFDEERVHETSTLQKVVKTEILDL